MKLQTRTETTRHVTAPSGREYVIKGKGFPRTDNRLISEINWADPDGAFEFYCALVSQVGVGHAESIHITECEYTQTMQIVPA